MLDKSYITCRCYSYLLLLSVVLDTSDTLCLVDVLLSRFCCPFYTSRIRQVMFRRRNTYQFLLSSLYPTYQIRYVPWTTLHLLASTTDTKDTLCPPQTLHFAVSTVRTTPNTADMFHGRYAYLLFAVHITPDTSDTSCTEDVRLSIFYCPCYNRHITLTNFCYPHYTPHIKQFIFRSSYTYILTTINTSDT